MEAPYKIFVGITDGKHYSIVGEGYPFAKEYISKESVMRWFEQYKENCKDDYLAVSLLEVIEDDFVQWLASL
jgi:hypothetical protein